MPSNVFAPWDDPARKPLIRFSNVTKRFGDFVAIDDLSLDIYEQEFFALLGPSGCGKTTMMRMLAGFDTPSEGQIELAGQNIVPVPPNKRAVNMMFQSYALFPHLSVWENIAFGLRRAKMPKADIEARVDEMLKLTRLERFARRKPHQISGGQRQRVALARSLAKAPKLRLLDEPLGALDKKLRQPTHPCRCNDAQVRRYKDRISGPLLDRFDLRIHVPPVEKEALMGMQTGESSNVVAQRVQDARKIQYQRQGEGVVNARLQTTALEKFAKPDQAGAKLLDTAMTRFALSARSYHRILKVARTIADLAQEHAISSLHIAEALQYRGDEI